MERRNDCGVSTTASVAREAFVLICGEINLLASEGGENFLHSHKARRPKH